MRCLAFLCAVACLLWTGCDPIVGAAQAAGADPVAGRGEAGEILGLVSDARELAGATVRLGEAGPAVPVLADGSFTFESVPAGCYEVQLERTGRAPIRLGGGDMCVRPSQSLIVSVVFGRP